MQINIEKGKFKKLNMPGNVLKFWKLVMDQCPEKEAEKEILFLYSERHHNSYAGADQQCQYFQ
jgi:hypothetical protein